MPGARHGACPSRGCGPSRGSRSSPHPPRTTMARGGWCHAHACPAHTAAMRHTLCVPGDGPPPRPSGHGGIAPVSLGVPLAAVASRLYPQSRRGAGPVGWAPDQASQALLSLGVLRPGQRDPKMEQIPPNEEVTGRRQRQELPQVRWWPDWRHRQGLGAKMRPHRSGPASSRRVPLCRHGHHCPRHPHVAPVQLTGAWEREGTGVPTEDELRASAEAGPAALPPRQR